MWFTNFYSATFTAFRIKYVQGSLKKLGFISAAHVGDPTSNKH